MNAENALNVEHAADRALELGGHVGRAAVDTQVAGDTNAKWAVVVDDRLIPMPRRVVRARDVLAQAGARSGILVRDLSQPQDIPIAADVQIDLAEGNVFRVVPSCEAQGEEVLGHGPAKLAFVMDDAWELTLQPKQSLESLRGLFDLPDDAEVQRDYQSPRDEMIHANSVVRIEDGPVFLSRITCITIKVNNHPVRMTKRRVTGLEIKQTAIAQGVAIDLQCVLYRIMKDGDLSAAIKDDQHVLLRKCDQFRCIAPDDNS